MGFHKIAPYYYTGWHEPATELQFLVNPRAFERLPEDLQAILVNAMRLAAYDMYTQSTHESAVNLETIQTEYPNVQIKTMPDAVIDAMREANDRPAERILSQRRNVRSNYGLDFCLPREVTSVD